MSSSSSTDMIDKIHPDINVKGAEVDESGGFIVPLVMIVIVCLAFYGIYTLIMGCLAKRKKAEYDNIA